MDPPFLLGWGDKSKDKVWIFMLYEQNKDTVLVCKDNISGQFC